MIGHLLGAAGAVESIICVRALNEGFIPPTIGYTESEEELDLDYVPNKGRYKDLKYALNNSLDLEDIMHVYYLKSGINRRTL